MIVLIGLYAFLWCIQCSNFATYEVGRCELKSECLTGIRRSAVAAQTSDRESIDHNALKMANQLHVAHKPGRIRAIALFEFLKGLLALALGFGLIASLDESLNEAAQELVLGLHLVPSDRLPHAFIGALANLHRSQVGIIVGSAVAYSLVRFAEAYGLWQERRWGAWVSAFSGGIYLPLEAYELSRGLSWFRVISAIANLVIVAYMALLLWRSRRSYPGE